MTDDKQVNYSGFRPLRIAHEAGSLEYVPSKDVVDLNDSLVRHNLRKQVRLRKRIMKGLDEEVREINELLDK